MVRLACVVVVLVVSGCGVDDPCKGVSGTCVGVPEGSSPEAVQQALIDVMPGGTVAFGAGTFDLRTGLSLDVDNVTVLGAGMDQTILSFAHQTDGAQGLYVTALHNFAIHDLAIENTKGDALKLLGTNNITIHKIHIK